MRTRKPSAVLTATLLELAGHMAMGVALGLGFAFVLTHIPALGIASMIDQSASPRDTMLMLVLTCAAMFSIGTTLTGLLLATMKDD